MLLLLSLGVLYILLILVLLYTPAHIQIPYSKLNGINYYEYSMIFTMTLTYQIFHAETQCVQ